MTSLALSVQGLTKCYGPRTKTPVHAVRDVSFEIARGEITGLLGPNGAGKTTAVKCICALVLPTAGGISVFGIDPLRHRGAALRQLAAVLEGNRNTYWRLSPRENIAFFSGLHGRSLRGQLRRTDALLQRFGLEEKRNTPVRALSRGMQQKVAIACALARDAKLLLLDEPALGLDVASTQEMRVLLQELVATERRTIIISSHDMELIQSLCKRVMIMDRGELVLDDSVENLVSVFQARAYRIELACKLPDALRKELDTGFPVLRIQSDDGGQTTIEADFQEERSIYDLISTLGSYGLPLRGVGRQYPHLKDIYLHAIGEELADRGAES